MGTIEKEPDATYDSLHLQEHPAGVVLSYTNTSFLAIQGVLLADIIGSIKLDT